MTLKILDEQLLEAVANDNNAEVERLIKAGANLDAQDINGNTALHLAVLDNNSNIIIKLLKEGADVNAKDINGSTALHLAAKSGHIEAVNKLKEAGANLDAQDINGNIALHLAVLGNHSEIADALKEAGADVNAVDENGQTVLPLEEKFCPRVMRQVQILVTVPEEEELKIFSLPPLESSSSFSIGSASPASPVFTEEIVNKTEAKVNKAEAKVNKAEEIGPLFNIAERLAEIIGDGLGIVNEVVQTQSHAQRVAEKEDPKVKGCFIS